MWIFGRMSNVKSWFGFGMFLYFWGLMDFIIIVFSGILISLGELEAFLLDKL